MAGALVAAGCLACTACGPSGERTAVGAFDLYRDTAPSGSVMTSLYYKRRLLTNRYGSSALDPRNAGRILFSSNSEANTDKEPCGTFLFDAATGRLERIAAWPDWLGAWSWSPDGQKLLLAGYTGLYPEVVDLSMRDSTPLTSMLSESGEQLEMHALGWSPDSQRLAASVHVTGDARGDLAPSWDLVELALSPPAAAYVASKQTARATWDATEYRWQDGRLISIGAGRDTPITQKAESELEWSGVPPQEVKRSPAACR